jgi:spectrin beta
VTKKGLDDHYEILLEKVNKRKQKLCDSLAVYKMYNDTELVETWVTERQSHLTAYLKVDKTFDLESSKIIQHRFEGFEQELNMNAERVKTVNQLADEIAAKDPSSADEINEKRDKLNSNWETLTKEAEEKKAELTACLVVQTLYSEITEPQAWILEKSGLLSSVEDPGADLSSVITLQRRLNTIERDIAAVPTKLQDLHAQAVDLSVQYPDEIATIRTKYDDLQKCWNNFTLMVKEKNETLVETGELKRLIISLDDFVNWLQQVSPTCSSEDLPQSLPEAESMLDAHFEVRTIIDQHADEYTTLLEEGPKFVKEEQNDLQTQSLRDQMEEMQQGWIQLQTLWDNRKSVLEQSMNHQLFLRDAKQSESILGQQELHLSKRGECPTADAVQEEMKKFEEFSKKCESQDDKINHVIQFAEQLCEKDHYAKDKIKEKANLIKDRRKAIDDAIKNLSAKLHEDLQLKQFLEDSDEVIDWMNERFLLASEESYEDLTNLRSKLMKHTAFEAELESNKTKIEALKKTGSEISEVDPENKPVVESRLQKIDDLWNILNKTSGEKKAHLTEANRVHEFNTEIQNPLTSG